MDKEKMELQKKLFETELNLLAARSEILRLTAAQKKFELSILTEEMKERFSGEEEAKNKPGLECVE